VHPDDLIDSCGDVHCFCRWNATVERAAIVCPGIDCGRSCGTLEGATGCNGQAAGLQHFPEQPGCCPWGGLQGCSKGCSNARLRQVNPQSSMATSCAASVVLPESTCGKAAGLLLSISDLDGIDVEDNRAAPTPDSDR